jgi:NADH:ubiquinone oxidoreductase subunit 3 (subunit A)
MKIFKFILLVLIVGIFCFSGNKIITKTRKAVTEKSKSAYDFGTNKLENSNSKIISNLGGL